VIDWFPGSILVNTPWRNETDHGKLMVLIDRFLNSVNDAELIRRKVNVRKKMCFAISFAQTVDIGPATCHVFVNFALIKKVLLYIE
jgi:hypothetical protein